MSTHKIPVHLTEELGTMKAPVLSIYYSGDTADITLNGTVITLTEGASSINIDTNGKTTSQVVSAITRSSLPYTGKALLDIDDVGATSLSLDSTDKTIDGGQILRCNGHVIRKLESSQIHILPPYNDSRYMPWNVVINRGYVVRKWKGTEWIFSIPEYEDQTWSTYYGRGYIDIEDEAAEVAGSRSIKVARTPILWDRNNISITLKGIEQPSSVIKDVDVNNGIIYLNKDVDESTSIYVSYTYREDGYIYPDVNLNPTEFHNPGVLNRYILFYLLPYIGPDGVRRNNCVKYSESSTLAGALNSIPNVGEPVMILGAAQVRPIQGIEDVSIVDTRVRGGGASLKKWDKVVKTNREALSVADKGFYDGRPYAGNMALFVRLPKELLTDFTRQEIDGIVKRFIAYGSYVFLEFD